MTAINHIWFLYTTITELAFSSSLYTMSHDGRTDYNSSTLTNNHFISKSDIIFCSTYRRFKRARIFTIVHGWKALMRQHTRREHLDRVRLPLPYHVFFETFSRSELIHSRRINAPTGNEKIVLQTRRVFIYIYKFAIRSHCDHLWPLPSKSSVRCVSFAKCNNYMPHASRNMCECVCIYMINRCNMLMSQRV